MSRGRVYLTDSELQKPRAWERVHCFDEKTGESLWTHSYEVDYADWAFNPEQKTGPNATPIVEGGRLFTVGSSTHLLCLDARRGTVIWERNLLSFRMMF